MPKATVFLVDDHAVVRVGVKALLEAAGDFDVVGEAGTGLDALREIARLNPDLVLMDITLPDMTGLEALAQIKDAAPKVQVVVLTMHQDEDYFFRALQAGAAGYVVKGSGSEDILSAMRAAQQGGVFLYPSLAKTLIARRLPGEDAPTLLKDLSARELEVLRLMGDGLRTKEMASRLGISVTTAQTYRTRIMEKLGLHTVAELIRYAIRKGIVRP